MGQDRQEKTRPGTVDRRARYTCLSPSENRRLDEYARRHCRSISSAIRALVVKGLGRNGGARRGGDRDVD